MDNRGNEISRYSYEIRTRHLVKANKLKEMFRESVMFSRPGPFEGAKILKTKDGIIALLVYLFTSVMYSLLLLNLKITGDMNFAGDFWIYALIALFTLPLNMSFAYTAPLENSLNFALKKYISYLVYMILIFILMLMLIIIMIVLAIIGLCLGLAVGILLIFYVLYRIFLAPGLIALTNKSPLTCIMESIELTKNWEGFGFFIVYIIVMGIIQFLSKYLLSLALRGNTYTLIIMIPLNIPTFIIAVSITLFAASFRKYMPFKPDTPTSATDITSGESDEDTAHFDENYP